ncbi:hypothetical protein HYH03_014815 [Edaphochlamys debaryana]|uniref:Uncharacterized protein n=1 Tax=Edaphochlamys debaryana TaxID=47281 RepID=A0A835XLZ0_9CHLO|nr:hypothetical protein HYH03_014815 [Edaphochlamys debaryana]|eukprot:KAG2486513.1 hypothetical protein HYH03_014815 [Edaphochlamys debaryana]
MSSPPAAPEQRPPKRPKASPFEPGPELKPESLTKFTLKLPHAFSPGALNCSKVAWGSSTASGTRTIYIASAQHTYAVSLGLGSAEGSAGPSVVQGKEGVLVPVNAEPLLVRREEPLCDMDAEVQCLSSGTHGGHQVLAAVDSVGNARLLATQLQGAGSGGAADGEGAPGRYLMRLDAPSRGECGWTGLAVRPLGPEAIETSGDPSAAASSSGLPPLELAVARQRMRDVRVYGSGELVRTIHTLQGPTSLTFLPPGTYGGCGDASAGLLAIAEEHQVALWDIRQGERGGCVQRLGVGSGGFPIYSMAWVTAVATATAASSGLGTGAGSSVGLLAVTGAERSVVVLEPRKWQVIAKWPGAVKYPATHMAASRVAPGFMYAAGLDYELAAGRWDGSSGGSAGNSNSSSGGHGRAVGPAAFVAARNEQRRMGAEGGGGGAGEALPAADDMLDGSSRAGLSFRGDSKWLGLALTSLPASGAAGGAGDKELVAALSLSGGLFVLQAAASGKGGETCN